MPSNSTLNRYYMIVMYAALGMGGSVFSIMAVGAAVFSAAKIFLGRLTMTRQPMILSVAVAGLAYFGSGLLIIAANPADAANYTLAVERLIFLGFLPLYLQISLMDRESLRDSLEIGAALGAAGVATWAMVEWAVYPLETISFRAHGAPGNPGPYATTAAVLFACCLLASFRAGRTRRPLFVAASLCAAFGLIMSGMRTVYPALIVLPVLLFITWPEARQRLAKRGAMWAFAASAVLLVSVGSVVLMSRLGHLLTMANFSGFSPTAANSIGERIALWHCAGQALMEAPLLGLGRSGAYQYMGECTNALVGQPIVYSHFHNAIATAAAFGGLVEISATVALLLVPFYWCWRYWRDSDARYAIVLILSVLAIYGLNGLANLMLGHDIHDMLFVHLIAVACALLAGSRAETSASGHS
ncbi:hypothetical protein DEM25_013055 [Oceaniradius stylonematis]|uniref:O-antigen ligase-related domain-containing protein n=1 Tax=Oceaniradius stylonematis TaxID=2184161 RepID=A0A3A8A850_9HYPH|nr:O-antigen ligase family protein [Oceaniradius stylonematis]RKF06507.1 hypothetical protein DEM25_013055 [Oceaniradius stylonematis]